MGVWGLGRLAAQRQYFLCKMAPLHFQGCEGAACPCLDTRLQPPEKTITNWFLFLFPPAVSLHRLPPKILPFRFRAGVLNSHLCLGRKAGAEKGSESRGPGVARGGQGGQGGPEKTRGQGGQGGQGGGQGGSGGARGGQGGPGGGGARKGPEKAREGQRGPERARKPGGTSSTEIGRVAPGPPAGGAWVPGICRQWVLGPGGGRGGARGCQRKCPPEALVVGGV